MCVCVSVFSFVRVVHVHLCLVCTVNSCVCVPSLGKLS